MHALDRWSSRVLVCLLLVLGFCDKERLDPLRLWRKSLFDTAPRRSTSFGRDSRSVQARVSLLMTTLERVPEGIGWVLMGK